MIAVGQHRVVIIGAGFGGLFAARTLRRADVHVTLINGTTYHLFQPLLYQVATGILSEGEVAPPIREVLKSQDNVDVRLGWVEDIDVDAKQVLVNGPGVSYTVPYDTLIVAAGSSQSYFGHDGFALHAPGMKSVDDALELRARIFNAFEIADVQTDDAARERWMTFVVVGAGATGTEMAGQIAELAHRTLPGQYRHIDPHQARIVLVDAVDRVLTTFDERLSTATLRRLHLLGVEVELDTKVVGVDETGVDVVTVRGPERFEAMTKVWAAGVAASPLVGRLAEAVGATTDRAGRVHVEPDATLPGHPEIFVVGDLMALPGKDGRQLPGVAQVAIQSGRHAAKQVLRRLAGKPDGQPFHYFDKGNMAVISRFNAVADIGGVRLSGFPAWLVWLGVHLFYLVGFKNRVTAVLHWAVSFLGRGRSERVSTLQQVHSRAAMREYGDPFAPRPLAPQPSLASADRSAAGPEATSSSPKPSVTVR
ncbi:NAD(P)/FAD-dependent oxidoreductase [Actinoplanes sp. NPDC051470]|uniref:NAD(P)/FAD-dependent oxidoreductase n=1 Tax=unclassified Actinoplanes TaxID=2626549 RepID=UPI00342B4C17